MHIGANDVPQNKPSFKTEAVIGTAEKPPPGIQV